MKVNLKFHLFTCFIMCFISERIINDVLYKDSGKMAVIEIQYLNILESPRKNSQSNHDKKKQKLMGNTCGRLDENVRLQTPKYKGKADSHRNILRAGGSRGKSAEHLAALIIGEAQQALSGGPQPSEKIADAGKSHQSYLPGAFPVRRNCWERTQLGHTVATGRKEGPDKCHERNRRGSTESSN